MMLLTAGINSSGNENKELYIHLRGAGGGLCWASVLVSCHSKRDPIVISELLKPTRCFLPQNPAALQKIFEAADD